MVLVPDEMVTMDPPPPAAMTGMAWRARRRAPARRDLDGPLPDAEIHADGVGVEAGVAPGRVVVDRVDACRTRRRRARRRRRRTPRGGRRSSRPTARPPAASTSSATEARAVGRDVADHHRRAGGGQPQRGGPTDVRGTAADQHDLALELSPRRRHGAIVGGRAGAPTIRFLRAPQGIGPRAGLHGSIVGVRVHRSFGFVDVSGFTALTELEGDERAVDVLTAFRSLLRDICARRGVRIAKWLGDGVMLVCVDTRPLLETILELHYVVGEVGRGRDRLHPLGRHLRRGDPHGGRRLHRPLRERRGAPVRPGLRRRGAGGPGGHGPPARAGARSCPRRTSPCAGWRSRCRRRASAWPASGADGARDPICGLPLTEDTAEEIAHDVRGSMVLFCSPGCVDTWRRRPARSLSRLTDVDACRRVATASHPEFALNIDVAGSDRYQEDGPGRPRNQACDRLSALDMSSNVAKFWRSYVYIGVLTYSLGAFAVLVLLVTTPGRTGRPW